MKHAIHLFLKIAVLWLLSCTLASATIQARVDRNPVAVGESFQLILSSDESPDDEPDLSPLAADFEVLSRQRASNTSLVNGKLTRNEQWILQLTAKRSGDLTIPAIAFGRQSSQPLQLTVNQTPQATANNSDLFLEVEVSTSKPFVQSEVIYSVRLFYSIELNGSLSEPELKDAVIERLGEDVKYTQLRNGIDYRVLERKYAIFPQQSGKHSISPLTLQAEVISHQAPSFNGFFSRPRTEQKSVVSKAIELDVQAMPAGFKAEDWLSASSLRLQDSWSAGGELRVQIGEPLTRTLSLQAKGATVAQLPELADLQVDGLKVYPDQPVLNENKQADGLLSVREEKIAYIASKPGQYAIPGRTIKWFNTETQRTEEINIAPLTLTVIGDAETVTFDPASQGTKDSANANNTPVAPQNEQQASADPLFWQLVSLGLFILWLGTLLLFWLTRQRATTPTASATHETTPVKTDKAIKRLKAACIANQPQAAKQALMLWASQNDLPHLAAIAQQFGGDLATQIQELNRQLYSAQPANWDGYPLWAAFSKQIDSKNNRRDHPDHDLQPLHKL